MGSSDNLPVKMEGIRFFPVGGSKGLYSLYGGFAAGLVDNYAFQMEPKRTFVSLGKFKGFCDALYKHLPDIVARKDVEPEFFDIKTNEKLAISCNLYNEVQMMHVRKHYKQKKGSDEFLPTTKGITIDLSSDEELDQFVTSLEKVVVLSTVFRKPSWKIMSKSLATWLEKDFLPHSPDEVDYCMRDAAEDKRLESAPGYNSAELKEFLEEHKNTIKNILLCRVLCRQLEISKKGIDRSARPAGD